MIRAFAVLAAVMSVTVSVHASNPSHAEVIAALELSQLPTGTKDASAQFDRLRFGHVNCDWPLFGHGLFTITLASTGNRPATLCIDFSLPPGQVHPRVE